jgi:hypothetical protein
MRVLSTDELERLVRCSFPQKRQFSACAELLASRKAVFASVHGGTDPFLERQFDDWLDGAVPHVAPYQLLNRLCRVGALQPGDYAITHPH